MVHSFYSHGARGRWRTGTGPRGWGMRNAKRSRHLPPVRRAQALRGRLDRRPNRRTADVYGGGAPEGPGGGGGREPARGLTAGGHSHQAILKGKRRVLLTLATGTGKTVIAFQIAWKLWRGGWNAKGQLGRRPRILFLADRSFLVDDPKDKTFAPFGDARHKISGGQVVKSREVYFATYQAIAGAEEPPPLYRA